MMMILSIVNCVCVLCLTLVSVMWLTLLQQDNYSKSVTKYVGIFHIHQIQHVTELEYVCDGSRERQREMRNKEDTVSNRSIEQNYIYLYIIASECKHLYR